MIRRPPRSTLFPYRRSSDLRMFDAEDTVRIVRDACHGLDYAHRAGVIHRDVKPGNLLVASESGTTKLDRKSTRLNSSHANISYAVFCLKKKNHILSYNLQLE